MENVAPFYTLIMSQYKGEKNGTGNLSSFKLIDDDNQKNTFNFTSKIQQDRQQEFGCKSLAILFRQHQQWSIEEGRNPIYELQLY